MFDLNNGVVRTKLLADKAQGDVYPVHKDQPDFLKNAINILGSQVTGKLWKSCGRKLGEKSVKLLIAKELSNTTGLREKQPNVVAKLMGLTSLPVQQKVPTFKKNLQDNYSPYSFSRILQQQQGEGYYHKKKYRDDLDIHEKSYKDVYEVKGKLSGDLQLENGNKPHFEDYNKKLAEKRMALVHQKFTEAKRLATNETLLQSKEFRDAIEVLSSNKDLFLKLLEEPNSLFSNQLKELNQTISHGSQTKCITVLKPTISADTDPHKYASKKQYACGEDTVGFDEHDWSSRLFISTSEAVSQPTRIVVLKASTEMPPESRCMDGDLIIDEDIRSRSTAKEITCRLQKDSYLNVTDFPNGCIADGNLVDGHEDDYGDERCSHGNDSELMTPTSSNSCVHLRSESPESLATYSHASYSLESSVSREAKKRLSERWESAIANDSSHELANVHKCSSTLGEILDIVEVRKGEDKADKLAISPAVSYHQEHYNSIARSKPSAHYKSIREKEDIFCTPASKSILIKQVTKMKNEKSSFKEKVSGILISRMRTLVREKPSLLTSLSSNGRLDESSSVLKDDHIVKDSQCRISNKNASKTLQEKIVKFFSPVSVSGTEKHGKGIGSDVKHWKSEISRENCNQPSYISVLGRPYQEDFPRNICHSSQGATISNPQALSRSPLISSVNRSSNWDSLHSNSAPMTSFKLFKLFSKEDEEQKRIHFIENLLSSLNLVNVSSTTLLAKSHSLESPLDPTMLDVFLDRKGEEAKCRGRRSNQMLYFDRVNEALKEICTCSLVNAYPWSATGTTQKHVRTNVSVRDAVWFHLKVCSSEEEYCTSGKAENGEKYVDYLVKQEVAGNGLAESMWLEKDELGEAIGAKILEELIDDVLADLTRR